MFSAFKDSFVTHHLSEIVFHRSYLHERSIRVFACARATFLSCWHVTINYNYQVIYSQSERARKREREREREKGRMRLNGKEGQY